MTVEQHIADVLAVADHLCRRFGFEKVHLMAHSWGSFIGLQAADGFLLEQCRARGDHRMVRGLERAPVTGEVPLPRRYEALRDAAMHRIGVGTTRAMRSVITGVFLPSVATSCTPARRSVLPHRPGRSAWLEGADRE